MSLEGNHPRAAIVAQADTRSQAGADVLVLMQLSVSRQSMYKLWRSEDCA